MGKIAYIDHSYHQKTKSTDFLCDILTSAGCHVDRFWDYSWNGGNSVPFESVEDYETIIFFQQPQAWITTKEASKKNLVFIPMLDGMGYTIQSSPNGLIRWSSYWSNFVHVKILNFSKTLHYICNAFGLNTKYFQYFPPVKDRISVPQTGLHGFFWLRREEFIPIKTVLHLIADTKFDSLHFHLAPDPNSAKPQIPSPEIFHRHNITVSHWLKDKKALDEILDNANVYFAPRIEEGIGQSYLEAMARGQCVIAPNFGTMNEYITNMHNGILYDLFELKKLDFSSAINIGRNAFDSCINGRKQWNDSVKNIVSFILN